MRNPEAERRGLKEEERRIVIEISKNLQTLTFVTPQCAFCLAVTLLREERPN